MCVKSDLILTKAAGQFRDLHWGTEAQGAVTSLKQRPLLAPGSRESGSPIWVWVLGEPLWGDADPLGAREAARMEPELGAGRGRCCLLPGLGPPAAPSPPVSQAPGPVAH